MPCKWYAEFEGICCCGDCPERADICPYEEQNKCEYYEQEGDELAKEKQNVVMCGECKCYEPHYNGEIGTCRNTKCNGLWKKDDFCSYGEKKREDSN